MQTDLPLKRLTRLCPADVLTLIGSPPVAVLGVETLELPASRRSLDTLLRLRDEAGQPYLHLIEWQNWRDPLFLWRVLDYLAWLGQNRTERPILVTVIYLTPEADTGATLHALRDGPGSWTVTFGCVRLWEQDAGAALSSGKPGLLALAPLMGGATATTVEQAAQQILAEVAPPAQGELLAALGVFAEPFLAAPAFIRLVTKERLMSSDLISYLLEDKVAEFAQEKAALIEEKMVLAEEKTALEATLRQRLQQAGEDILIGRFPNAPVILARQIRQVSDPDRLQALIQTLAGAPDLAAVEQAIAAAQPPV